MVQNQSKMNYGSPLTEKLVVHVIIGHSVERALVVHSSLSACASARFRRRAFSALR